MPPEQARSQDQTTGPNGLIERQVTKELLDLFNIDEQTLNTQGLQITTTIDPKAQKAAEEAVSKYLDGQDPDMRTAVVSIDPKTGGVKAYYGGSDANGFDFAQAGLPTGSSFKVFALVAALQQGMGLGYQVDSSPVDGQRHQDHQRRRRRVRHLQHRRGVEAVAEHQLLPADAQAEERPRRTSPTPRTRPASPRASPAWTTRCPRTARADRPTTESCWASTRLACSTWRRRTPRSRRRASTTSRTSCRRWSTRGARCCSTPSQEDNSGEQRIDKAVADNVTSAMQPIAGYSNGHNLAGGRPSAAKTGTNQLGDTGANRDAWMVGYTPSLSTAVWVGTTEGTKPLENKWGSPVYGSGLPSDIWKSTMDGALEDTENESFPKPTEIGGYAGVPQAPPPPPSATAPPPPSETVIQPTIEVAPGITIPIGPPTTVPIAPPAPVGPAPGPPGAPPAGPPPPP